MFLNIAVCMTNSVDPDQTSHYTASDLDLHYLQRSVFKSVFRLYRIYPKYYRRWFGPKTQ